jgi:general stress protein 26
METVAPAVDKWEPRPSPWRLSLYGSIAHRRATVASGMDDQDHIERIWDLIEKVGVCMLTTQFAGGLRARPVEARPNRDAGLIYVVTDVESPKEEEVEAASDVCLVFIDSSDKAYLSISARAKIERDMAKIKSVWKESDELWWRGPTDPHVCLLRIELVTAELWDGPASGAVAVFEIAKSALTGRPPNLGENRKVTVAMQAEHHLP